METRNPAIFDAAYLLNCYKSEYAMTEIPALVQKDSSRLFYLLD